MKNPTNGELAIMLKNMAENMTKGFEGVHARQDTTNGKVIKNTEYRLKQTGALSLIKFIGYGNLVVVIGLLVDRFLN